ncbi:MAG: hypothetical protein R3B09_12000 [Nannocystaceae bacterium]
MNNVGDRQDPPDPRPGRGAARPLYGLFPLALPLLVYYLWICNESWPAALVLPTSLEELRAFASHAAPTWRALGLTPSWFGFQALLQIAAPGKWVKGAELEDGTRLPYKMNGWTSWLVTLATVAALVGSGVLPATILYDEFGPLLTVINLFSYVLTAYLYALGRRKREGEARGGAFFYDFFMGTALNPGTGASTGSLP